MNEANTLLAFELMEQLVNNTETVATSLERLTAAANRTTTAFERIATVLEAHLELATKSADPEQITATKVREARRELLFVYAEALGVNAWAEGGGIELPKVNNDDIRRWCLNKLAGEELVPF